MDLGLTGKVALVAAGSRGLGRAIAEELVAEGAAVAICSRGQDALDDACAGLTANGGNVLGVAADVSIPEDIQRVARAALDRFGRVDILVTNSGGPRAGAFEDLGPADWDGATRLLLFSVVNFARHLLPGMKERRWGRILNVTSISAKQPVDGLMLSNSVRGAVTAFGRSLANEMAPWGITVNNLMPGYTRTERVDELADHKARAEGVSPDEIVARWEREIPMGRLAEPREFAALAVFLASERASYITGSSIAVDGGWIRSVI